MAPGRSPLARFSEANRLTSRARLLRPRAGIGRLSHGPTRYGRRKETQKALEPECGSGRVRVAARGERAYRRLRRVVRDASAFATRLRREASAAVARASRAARSCTSASIFAAASSL